MTRAAISLALVLTMPAAFADGVTNLHNGTTGNVGIVNGGAGGGGQPSTPLHVVATNGVLQNLTFDQTTNARTQTVSRIPIVFACAATNVVFVFDNFYLQSGGTVDGAQAITIVKLALENTAPVATTPVTFGGQRNVTLAPGTVAQRSDAIAGPVVANQLYWIRVTATTPNVGLWQLGPFADPAFTGAAMYMYPPSQNIDQVDLTGALTQPGPSAIRPQAFGPTATLGNCSGTNNRSVVNIGASWSFGVDDPFASARGGAAMHHQQYSNCTRPRRHSARRAQRRRNRRDPRSSKSRSAALALRTRKTGWMARPRDAPAPISGSATSCLTTWAPTTSAC